MSITKHLIRGARPLLLATILFGSSLFVRPASAASCACYCEFPDIQGKSCGGQTKHLTDIDIGNSDPFDTCVAGNAVQTTCQNACQNATFQNSPYRPILGGGGQPIGAVASYNILCDFNDADNCQSAINSSAPGCSNASTIHYCYCKYPSNMSPSACAGKTFQIEHTFVDADANCPAFCDNVRFTISGQEVAAESAGNSKLKYDDACDYNSKTSDCAPKNPSSSVCQSEKETNQAKAKANAAILGNAQRGSPLSLPLPLSDISPAALIGRVINQILGIVGAIAFLMFVWGGFSWMLAAGNEDKIKTAKATIVWSILGLIAIFGAYAILSVIFGIFSGVS